MRTLAETATYQITQSEDGEVTYLELGNVRVTFLREEWVEFLELVSKLTDD